MSPVTVAEKISSCRIEIAALAGAATFAFAAPACAVTQAQIGVLTAKAQTNLQFARYLQGRWSCAGTDRQGAPIKAAMLLFTSDTHEPRSYEFELTPIPASPKWPNIIETWQWQWQYNDQGQWFATPDKRTADAGIQYSSDGWRGTRLLWIQRVSQSTISRTFDRLPDGTLALALHKGVLTDPASIVYKLSCKREGAKR